MDLGEFSKILVSVEKSKSKALIASFIDQLLELEFPGRSARDLSLNYFPQERPNFISYLKHTERASLSNFQRFVDQMEIDFDQYNIEEENGEIKVEYIGHLVLTRFAYCYIDSNGRLKVDLIVLYRNKSVDLIIERYRDKRAKYSVVYRGIYSIVQSDTDDSVTTYLQFNTRIKESEESVNKSLIVVDRDITNTNQDSFYGVYSSFGLDAGRCMLYRKDPIGDLDFRVGTKDKESGNFVFDLTMYESKTELYEYMLNSNVRRSSQKNVMPESILSKIAGKYIGITLEYSESDVGLYASIIILEFSLGLDGTFSYISPNTDLNVGKLEFYNRDKDILHYVSSRFPRFESNNYFEIQRSTNSKKNLTGHYYTTNNKGINHKKSSGNLLMIRNDKAISSIKNKLIPIYNSFDIKDKDILDTLFENSPSVAKYLLEELQSYRSTKIKKLIMDPAIKTYLQGFNDRQIFGGRYLITIDHEDYVQTMLLKVGDDAIFKCYKRHKSNASVICLYSGNINNNCKDITQFYSQEMQMYSDEEKAEFILPRVFILVLFTPEYLYFSQSAIKGSITWQSSSKEINACDVRMRKISDEDFETTKSEHSFLHNHLNKDTDTFRTLEKL